MERKIGDFPNLEIEDFVSGTEMVKNFGDFVYKIKVTTKDILIDTRILGYDVFALFGGFPEEEEVILKPKKYEIERVIF